MIACTKETRKRAANGFATVKRTREEHEEAFFLFDIVGMPTVYRVQPRLLQTYIPLEELLSTRQVLL
jgi:hypothetical protein